MATSASLMGAAALSHIPQSLPIFASEVRAGFLSPTYDHLDADIDLQRHVVKRPPATFFVRAKGDSMIGDGMHHGDLLVVDRSLEPLPGSVIVIAVDGELTVKWLERLGERV